MKIDVEFDTKSDPAAVVAIVTCHDHGLIGHDATLTLTAKAEVHDSRPVHSEKKVLSQSFKVSLKPERISIPRHKLPAYTYRGKHLDVELHAKLKVDDGLIFDTTLKEEVSLELARTRRAPSGDGCAKHLIEPKDAFNFWANWRAIPGTNKIAALGLAATLAVVGTVNSWIGYHDEFSPDGQTYIYSHRDSDGDSQSPMVNSSYLTGGAAVAVWFALRRQLRKYMTFKAHGTPTVDRSTPVCVGELFRGRSRVPLHNIVLRVVACNMEKGQYTRGSGSKRRTVSFTEPVRGVVLFEKRVAEIAAHAAVEKSFPETFCFEPMFDVLYPPNKVSDSHGVGVYWEIQLLHDQYVDQEIVGSLSKLQVDEFYDVEAESQLSAPLPAEF